jgi:hypothetical protein
MFDEYRWQQCPYLDCDRRRFYLTASDDMCDDCAFNNYTINNNPYERRERPDVVNQTMTITWSDGFFVGDPEFVPSPVNYGFTAGTQPNGD